MKEHIKQHKYRDAILSSITVVALMIATAMGNAIAMLSISFVASVAIIVTRHDRFNGLALVACSTATLVAVGIAYALSSH